MNTLITNNDAHLSPSGATGVDITVTGTAADLADSIAAWPEGKTKYVSLSVKTEEILYTTDGSTPVDAGAGMLLSAGDPRTFSYATIRAMKIVRGNGADATIRIEGMA